MEPSTLMSHAPLDSIFRSRPETWLALKLLPPLNCISAREVLKRLMVMLLVGARSSLEPICRVLPLTAVLMSGRRFWSVEMLSAGLPLDHLIFEPPATTTLEKSEIKRSSVLITPSPLIPAWEHPATTVTAAISIIVILLMLMLDAFDVRMMPNDENCARQGMH